MKKLVAILVLMVSATPVSAIEIGSNAIMLPAASSILNAESKALKAQDSAAEFSELHKHESPVGMQLYRTNYAPDQKHVFSLEAGLSDLSKKAEANINLSLSW